MARKLPKRAASEDSSALSSAPSDTAELESVAGHHIQSNDQKSNDSKGKRKFTEFAEDTRSRGKPAPPTPKKETEQSDTAATKSTRRRKTVKVEEEEEEEEEDNSDVSEAPKTAKRGKRQSKKSEDKPKNKRKTKEEKEAEAMPLAARTIGHKMFIGAHVSAAGGVQNGVINAVHIGANAFALFLKSQRKWANPPMDPEQCSAFHTHCTNHSFSQRRHVVPHGSYLVNLAHTDPVRTTQAYGTFLDDLQRCENLGITLYNFHPGNCATSDRPAAIAHLAQNLNRAHSQTSTVITLLENMAAGGNVLGSTFEDLRDIISLVSDKSRVGVCFDTCHAFAGGYDLRTPEALQTTLSRFDETVGLQYLRAVHLNDSKAPFRSHRDLHANIGTGYLGLRAFHALVNDPRFQGLPMVLETPIEVRDAEGNLVKDEKGKEKEDKGIWAREIKLLESLVGMDVESRGFLDEEERLGKMGAVERKRVGEQVDRKEEKTRLAEEKKKNGKGKKKTTTTTTTAKARAAKVPGKRKKDAGEEMQSDGSSLSDLSSENDDA